MAINWETNNYNNVHILPKISRSKGSQIKKFGHVIEYNVRITVSIYFCSSQLEHTIKANCIKCRTVAPEIYY